MQKDLAFLGLEIKTSCFEVPTIQSSEGAREPADGLRLNTLGVGTGVSMPRSLGLFELEMRSLIEKDSSQPRTEK